MFAHVPAKEGELLDPERSAPKGSIYFHNTSVQSKGTGSYFTPSFVVEHLLERTLDPTVDEHLARVKELLDAGDHAGAADLFFDFRVGDLAMGSGHFLTAAIDHLETAMAAFLADHPIPGVTNELRHLEASAREAAGPDAPEPEPSSLLRREGCGPSRVLGRGPWPTCLYDGSCEPRNHLIRRMRDVLGATFRSPDSSFSGHEFSVELLRISEPPLDLLAPSRIDNRQQSLYLPLVVPRTEQGVPERFVQLLVVVPGRQRRVGIEVLLGIEVNRDARLVDRVVDIRTVRPPGSKEAHG